MRGAAHKVHYVRHRRDVYHSVPISVGSSILEAHATAGMGPTIYREWFMDPLREGDQVLFRAECNKHNNFQFWLSNPDHKGQEYRTFGIFRPDQAQTNTAALCRSGRLRPEVARPAMPGDDNANRIRTRPRPDDHRNRRSTSDTYTRRRADSPGYLSNPTGPAPAYLPRPENAQIVSHPDGNAPAQRPFG